MSKIDEDQIRERLKTLSQAAPSQEATDRATQKARDALTDCRVGTAHHNVIGGPRPTLPKLAAAAVLMIGLAYLGGRLSAPAPLDVEQLTADIESSLKSSLEQAIRQDILKEMDTRWESAFAARSVKLKDEFQQQVRRDLMEFASQTLAYAGNQTDQRLAELIQQIDAARLQERLRVAKALQYLESNRLQDRNRFGNGLVTLAARTNELLSPE
jgi:hypothetical protein